MTSTDLELVKVTHEREWALEAWQARLTFPQMRALAIQAPEDGGLGYPISLATAKGLVLAAREAHGDLSISREARVERQDMELDARMAAARHDLNRAYATQREPAPDPAEFFDPLDHVAALNSWHKRQELALKMIESADRRLDQAMKNERDLHGLNAPTRIEADVTTRDGLYADLDAAIASLDAEVEV